MSWTVFELDIDCSVFAQCVQLALFDVQLVQVGIRWTLIENKLLYKLWVCANIRIGVLTSNIVTILYVLIEWTRIKKSV